LLLIVLCWRCALFVTVATVKLLFIVRCDMPRRTARPDGKEVTCSRRGRILIR
jgi:hypothetical protein